MAKFIENPFSDKAFFNEDKYKKVVKIFTRMLDNVVEVNGLPLEKQQEEIKRKRRHGMGLEQFKNRNVGIQEYKVLDRITSYNVCYTKLLRICTE